MMMSIGRMSGGKTASKLARAVVGKGEMSLQRGVVAASSNGLLSTMSVSGLGVGQAPNKLPVVKLPFRQLSAGAVTADMKAVAAATVEWKDTVTLNTDDAPKKTAALYSPDAVFWGTVSEEVRATPEQFLDYFEFFARLPKLRLVEYNPGPVRVHGDCAVHGGSYVFAWQGADGATVEANARFTFSYKKENGRWVIIKHHSSKMPTAPPGLPHVKNQVTIGG